MTDEEFRDLAERTQAIGDWWDMPAAALYVDRLSAEVGKHNRRILGGDLTPEQYQKECGVIQGLQVAAGLVEQARREFERVAMERAEEALQAEA